MLNIRLISEKVNRLVGKYRTRDPFALCSAMGVHVYRHDLGKLQGYCFCRSRVKNIVLSSRADSSAQRLLCAHELGHTVLHFTHSPGEQLIRLETLKTLAPTEKEANIFAAELLITDGEVSALTESGATAADIARRLCLPAELVMFKLEAMKARGLLKAAVIDEPRSDFLKAALPRTDPDFTDAPDGDFPADSPDSFVDFDRSFTDVRDDFADSDNSLDDFADFCGDSPFPDDF